MTPEAKKRVEEIRSYRERFLTNSSPDVITDYLEFLLTQLDEAHEALRFYGLEGGCRDVNDCSVAKGRGNTRMLRPGKRARKALGEE